MVLKDDAELRARARDILQLLGWQFNRPVLIANVIAWPISALRYE